MKAKKVIAIALTGVMQLPVLAVMSATRVNEASVQPLAKKHGEFGVYNPFVL